MTGKDRPPASTAQVSIGGSLIADAKLQALYTTMIHCRLLAERASAMRIKGFDTHPYSASIGQEALAAGWVSDLQPSDTIALAPGDCTPSLVKGVPLPELFAQLNALRSGVRPPSVDARNVLMATPDVREQCGMIAATAFANKRKKKGNVVVSFASTATMATAPWQELVALAAKKKLPILFTVENNPRIAIATVSDADDFIEKARSYGLTGISVDGNDVVAVYRVAYESLDRVRKGGGPVMVEGKTYCESGRNGRSRSKERDPLIHMERYLRAKKLFKPSWKDRLVEEFEKELNRAVKAARKADA